MTDENKPNAQEPRSVDLDDVLANAINQALTERPGQRLSRGEAAAWIAKLPRHKDIDERPSLTELQQLLLVSDLDWFDAEIAGTWKQIAPLLLEIAVTALAADSARTAALDKAAQLGAHDQWVKALTKYRAALAKVRQ